MTPRPFNRRLFLTAAGASLAAPALLRAAAPWPRQLRHALGTTTLVEPPRRIVSVGYHEQDFIYALGIAPVGVHEWFGGYPHATWPWADGARKALNAAPEVQTGFEVDIEWVYAQQPDPVLAAKLASYGGSAQLMRREAV